MNPVNTHINKVLIDADSKPRRRSRVYSYTDALIADIYQTGVYSVTNLVTGDQYIGSTRVHFYNRWTKHLKDFKSREGGCRTLNAAVRIYGLAQFKFIILEITAKTETRIREQYWLNKLKPAYNIAKDVNTVKGIEVESTRVPVMQFTREGEFLKEWPSCKIAALYFNLSIHHVNTAGGSQTTRSLTAGGFVWIKTRYFSKELLEAKVKRITSKDYVSKYTRK